MMKKYNSQATKWLVIPSLISIAMLITGVVCVIVDISDIISQIGLISLGGLFSILFIACCLAEGSRYLTIDDEKIDLPRGADINGKTALKRTVAAIDGINSIESALRKGNRIVTKDTNFYSLRMKDGAIISFTLYAYGKNEEEIISTLKKKIGRMKPIINVCNEPGTILKKSGSLDDGSAHGFLVVKKYPLLYAENLSRFDCPQQIYGLPFGKVPNKEYLGTDRDGENEYALNLKQQLSPEEQNLIARMKNGDCEIFTSEADALLFLGMISNADDYEIIHCRAVGCDEAYPRDYTFLGYDIGYPASNAEAFSIICDCMFICRWHGCDKEGTLFADDFNKLNENGLFDSFDDAYHYMVKYLNEDWSEKGDYYIFEIRRK